MSFVKSFSVGDGDMFYIRHNSDAVALDDNGQPDVVLDWKSDVAPDEHARGVYRGQVTQYVGALGAKRGAVVYMTAGRVEWVDDADLGRLPFCEPDRGDSEMPSEDSR